VNETSQICNKYNLQRFQAGTMPEDELIEFADHLLICDCCQSELIEGFEDECANISPPSGLSESILHEVNARKSSEFLKYCVKVTAAACFALFILFSGLPQTVYEFSSRTIEEEADVFNLRHDNRNRILFREDVYFEYSQ